MKPIKILTLLSVFSLFLIGVNVFAHNSEPTTNIEERSVESEREFKLEPKKYFSKYFKFTEKSLDSKSNLVASEYEVWFNENGEYRMNTISGPLEGDYEVWDGMKLYQYTKVINDLYIRNIVNDHETRAIPHRLFDSGINDKIQNDIRKNILTKGKEEGGVYTKIVNDDKTLIKIDNEGFITESSFSSGGNIFHEIKVLEMKDIASFDLKLLIVDQNDAHVSVQ